MINVVLVVSSIAALKKNPREQVVFDFISSRKPIFDALPCVPDDLFVQFAFDNRRAINSIAHVVSHVFESASSLGSLGLSSDRTSVLVRLGINDSSFSKDLSRSDRLTFEHIRAKLLLDFVLGNKTLDQLNEIAQRIKITINDPAAFDSSKGVRFTNCRSEVVEYGDISDEVSHLEKEFGQISLRLLHIEGILLSDKLFAF